MVDSVKSIRYAFVHKISLKKKMRLSIVITMVIMITIIMII